MAIDLAGDRPGAFPRRGRRRTSCARCIRYAVLAPSSHNAQPWLFRIQGDILDLVADRSRALPVADPHDRELVISCGAALECLAVAARGTGHMLAIEILPDPFDRDWIARARLQEDGAPSERERRLFEAIPHRRSTRRPFEAATASAGAAGRRCRRGGRGRSGADRDRRRAGPRRGRSPRRRRGPAPVRRPGLPAELADWINLRAGAGGDGVSGAALGLPALLAPFIALAVRAFDLGKGAAATDEDLAAAPGPGRARHGGRRHADWDRRGPRRKPRPANLDGGRSHGRVLEPADRGGGAPA